MRIIAGARQSGKTLKLIQIAKATNGYLLVHNHIAYEYCVNAGMPRDRVLRIGDFKNGNLRGRTLNGPLYIDNIELMFQAMLQDYSSNKFSAQIAAASISLAQEDIDLMFNKLVIEDIILAPTE